MILYLGQDIIVHSFLFIVVQNLCFYLMYIKLFFTKA